MKSAIRRIARNRGALAALAALAVAPALAAGPGAATEGYFALGYGPDPRARVAIGNAGNAGPLGAPGGGLWPG